MNWHKYIPEDITELYEVHDFKHAAAILSQEFPTEFEEVILALRKFRFSKEDIVFIDLAFIDLKDISVINQFYDSLFEVGRKPARTVYQAAALPFDGRIKVMAIAIK